MEHEAVADDADVGPVAEDVAQLAEKVRAVARQFLHALRQRQVQPLAEIGEAQLRVLVLLLGSAERIFERADLFAQRADLLIEVLDLRHGARGRFLLQIDLGVIAFARSRRGILARAGCAAQPVALAFDGGERGAQLRHLVLEIGFAGLLQRQQLAQPRDLRIEPRQRGVLAGDFLRQEELRHHEHGEQKDHAQDQGRQRVDESRPVIHAAIATAAGERHGAS